MQEKAIWLGKAVMPILSVNEAFTKLFGIPKLTVIAATLSCTLDLL